MEQPLRHSERVEWRLVTSKTAFYHCTHCDKRVVAVWLVEEAAEVGIHTLIDSFALSLKNQKILGSFNISREFIQYYNEIYSGYSISLPTIW